MDILPTELKLLHYNKETISVKTRKIELQEKSFILVIHLCINITITACLYYILSLINIFTYIL